MDLMRRTLLIASALFILVHTYKDPSLAQIFNFVDSFGTQPLYSGIGSANFSITTNIVLAQTYFNQGIALLHGFSPFEALRSFRKVVALDNSTCMGYYGIYKALQWDRGYIRGRNESLSTAISLSKNATEREQLFILAENGNFQWYNLTYQTIFQKYDDLQAKVFWAWNVIDNSVTTFGNPKPIREQAQDLLNTLVVIYPENAAIHHYIVHAWEDTYYPENAINSSLILKTYPSAPHMNHMPGHIYNLIGDYAEAHTLFLYSYNSDLAYMNQYNIGIENHWEFIHNLAYLVANLAEAGRYSESISFALQMQSLQQKNPDVQVLDFNPDTSRSAARFFFQGLCSLPFVYFRYSNWETADAVLNLIILKNSDLFNATNTYLLDYFQALRVWAQGMNFVLKNDFTSAGNCSNELYSYLVQLNKTMSESVAYDYSVVARSYFALNVQHAELEALSDRSNGTYDYVIAALQEAVEMEDNIPYNEPTAYPRPVRTSLAETYIAYANAVPDRKSELLNEAINVYQQILDSPLHSNSGFALYGIGYCYQLMGDTQSALNAYDSFLAAWSGADNLPQVMVATTYTQNVKSNNPDNTFFITTIVLAATLGIVLLILLRVSLLKFKGYKQIRA